MFVGRTIDQKCTNILVLKLHPYFRSKMHAYFSKSETKNTESKKNVDEP